jgi:hypothetical protein
VKLIKQKQENEEQLNKLKAKDDKLITDLRDRDKNEECLKIQ